MPALPNTQFTPTASQAINNLTQGLLGLKKHADEVALQQKRNQTLANYYKGLIKNQAGQLKLAQAQFEEAQEQNDISNRHADRRLDIAGRAQDLAEDQFRHQQGSLQDLTFNVPGQGEVSLQDVSPNQAANLYAQLGHANANSRQASALEAIRLMELERLKEDRGLEEGTNEALTQLGQSAGTLSSDLDALSKGLAGETEEAPEVPSFSGRTATPGEITSFLFSGGKDPREAAIEAGRQAKRTNQKRQQAVQSLATTLSVIERRMNEGGIEATRALGRSNPALLRTLQDVYAAVEQSEEIDPEIRSNLLAELDAKHALLHENGASIEMMRRAQNEVQASSE